MGLPNLTRVGLQYGPFLSVLRKRAANDALVPYSEDGCCTGIWEN